MFKRFLSDKARQKSESDKATEVSSARGRSSELLSVPSLDGSSSRRRSSSISQSGLGLHVIHEPEFTALNIVFVHGLGGHSQKTWSKNHDESFFWPELWLPFEPGLGSARILTFGYNAAWRGATKSISSITDFAKELLFEMQFGKNSAGEDLQLGANPIIFVVHSMGGLVVKKACLLGLHDTNYQDMIQAVSAIMFLSTPHRGTNLAETLNRVLAASFQSSKNFLSDLNKSSTAIEELNEQFRHMAPRLTIWSFYETLATAIGPRKIMVLEKDSSVLGYPTEISRPLQADHHDVCKFASPVDSSYVTVRNAIKSLVTRFRVEALQMPVEDSGVSTAVLSNHLNVEDLFRNCPSSEADYTSLRSCWIADTCTWFLEEPEYVSWETPSCQPAILLYTAPPANGKSVLSTFIINHLRNKGMPCQYFLFKYSDSGKRMVANCIKSLAFQLARSQNSFKHLLSGASRESLGLDSSDSLSIWRSAIEGLLVKSGLRSPMYWVIDALDESDSPKVFLECLKSLGDRRIPVKILILSRSTDVITLGIDRLSLHIPVRRIEKPAHGHNKQDIELLVERELSYMRGSDQFHQQLQRTIMKRSEGNFLWAKLVLEEVMSCHTEEDIRKVLEEIPDDMTQMYERMESNLLRTIRQSDKELIIRLLEWCICAQRPLSLKELSQALQPEYSGFLDFKRTIQDTCGQFIQVGQDGKVKILHYTAREYLARSSKSDLRIDSKKGHERLFRRTLAVFEDEGLRWRVLRNQHALQSMEPLVFYSAMNWPFHLGHSACYSSENLDALVRFFKSPGILTWVHVLSLIQRLEILVKTSKILEDFVTHTKRRNASQNPMLHRLSDLELLSEWNVDLLKIVGRFAGNIVAKPSVLYDVVPALCPPKSITHKTFCKSANIQVIGAADDTWNDNLCRLALPSGVQTWRLACAGKYLAVLGSNGTVYIWDSTNFSEISIISNDEPITSLAFSLDGRMLCTYGMKSTKLWSVLPGTLISSTPNPPRVRAIALVFSENDRKLIFGGDDNNIWHTAVDDLELGWNILNKNLLQVTSQSGADILSSPMCLAFNGDRTQVGVSYRGAPLSIWDLRDGRCINRCRRANESRYDQRRPSTNWFAVDRFTWNPVTGHIIGLYKDGCIFKWHPMTDENVEANRTADEVAASPSGKVFATSSSDGSVRVWNFAYFTVIYQISSESLVTELAFSPDSRRLYDLRDGFVNAWESNSLTRFIENEEHISDTNSEDQSSTAISKFSEETVEHFEAVTVLSLAPDRRSYCVGYEDGGVSWYSTHSTEAMSLTRFHNLLPVTQIAWSPDGQMLALADLAGDIQLRKIDLNSTIGLGLKSTVLPAPRMESNDHNIEQMLLGLDGQLLFISTPEASFVFSTKDGNIVTRSSLTTDNRDKWLCHPARSDIILRCGAHKITAYKFDTLQLVWSKSYPDAPIGRNLDNSSSMASLNLDKSVTADENPVHKIDTNLEVKKAMLTQDGTHMLLCISKPKGTRLSTDQLTIIPKMVLDETETAVDQSAWHPVFVPPSIISHILFPLGILSNSRLVFLDHEFWLCSYPLARSPHSPVVDTYHRFYFIPRNWVTKDSLEQCVLGEDGTLFWPKADRVVLIRCNLDNGIRSRF
ncbi:hypothetical protein F5Y16DRAFT_402357 [Xylariaceae sp. FL0255]|nr:hypothetical protein F5Y16DRAFT_402357 [Xylariaceae sp. FL0255]